METRPIKVTVREGVDAEGGQVAQRQENLVGIASLHWTVVAEQVELLQGDKGPEDVRRVGVVVQLKPVEGQVKDGQLVQSLHGVGVQTVQVVVVQDQLLYRYRHRLHEHK